MRPGLILACLLAGLAGGCVPKAVPGGFEAVAFASIPGWRDDAVSQSLPALRAGCRRLMVLPPDTGLGGRAVASAEGGLAGQWAPACEAARMLAPGDDAGVRRYYERWFTPYRVGSPGLFTGYYEPEIRGALARGGAYQVPVLARPADLLRRVSRAGDTRGEAVTGRLENGRLVAYWSRAEIEAGRMGTMARPLLWLADPVDLFFLQVQGAGRIRLPDGGLVRVGYDGKNGLAYTPIGRVLIARHALTPEEVSMQSIRAWLAAHPGEQRAVMDANEDYVFFRVLSDTREDAGPPGALGVALQAGRSAAVDRQEIPLGAPVFVDSTDAVSGRAWQRLLLAQDVGSDIVGPGRVDVFFGAGEQAELQAGRMHQAGSVYVLLPRPAEKPVVLLKQE